MKMKPNKYDVIVKKHPKLEAVIPTEIREDEAEQIHVLAVHASFVGAEPVYKTNVVKYNANLWMTKLESGASLSQFISGDVIEVLHDGTLKSEKAAKPKAEKAENETK